MVAHNHGGGQSTTNTNGMEGSTSGMSTGSTFFTATNTAIYSNSWTPKSIGGYAGTCIFLIVLAIIFRAVFTVKSFLEARAIESALKRRYVVVEGESGMADKIASDANSMTGILTTNGVAENVRIAQAPVRHVQPFRFGVDMPRAALMMVATGIGYLL
jgi:copper transporter 1